MYEEVQEFIQYCFEHGSFLRNHKQFGEMSNKLLSMSTDYDVAISNTDIIKKYVLSPRYVSELLYTAAPEMNMSVKGSDEIGLFTLVYIFDHAVGDDMYMYVYSGIRRKQI